MIIPDHPLEAKLYLSNNEGVYLIDLNTILRAEAHSNYSIIICKGGEKHLMTKSLKYLDEKLPDNSFIRVHKSHIVNIREITFIDNKSIHLGSKHSVPRSKTYHEGLAELLRHIK